MNETKRYGFELNGKSQINLRNSWAVIGKRFGERGGKGFFGINSGNDEFLNL